MSYQDIFYPNDIYYPFEFTECEHECEKNTYICYRWPHDLASLTIIIKVFFVHGIG